MKIILYRILTLFFIFLGGPFLIICGVGMPISHYMIIYPIAYLLTGKWITTDYIEKLLDSYMELFNNLQKKGDYEQADNSNNEER